MGQVHTKLTPEQHKRSQRFAIFTYSAVIITFVSICAIAVISTMNAEKNKQGFRAIKVTQPISFIDTTYLDDASAETVPETP